jgi:hypothetical protein
MSEKQKYYHLYYNVEQQYDENWDSQRNEKFTLYYKRQEIDYWERDDAIWVEEVIERNWFKIVEVIPSKYFGCEDTYKCIKD